MQSYGAARFVFDLFGLICWAVIIIGAIVALGGVAALGTMSRSFGATSLAGLAGLAPGLGIMFLGFVGLVFTQIGRASVDAAEYAQQNLKVARDQLEISRQTLAQGAALERGYAELQEVKAQLRGMSGPTGLSPGQSLADVVSEPKASEDVEPQPGDFLDYRGRTIRVVKAGFHFGGIDFPTIEEAITEINCETDRLQRKPESAPPYASQLGINDRLQMQARIEPEDSQTLPRADEEFVPRIKLRLPSER